MACLTRVASDPFARKGSHMSVSSIFRRTSPALATLGDKQVGCRKAEGCAGRAGRWATASGN